MEREAEGGERNDGAEYLNPEFVDLFQDALKGRTLLSSDSIVEHPNTNVSRMKKKSLLQRLSAAPKMKARRSKTDPCACKMSSTIILRRHTNQSRDSCACKQSSTMTRGAAGSSRELILVLIITFININKSNRVAE